jgi:hypothetical protein
MGQYKLMISYRGQIGFLIMKDADSIEIHLPFISIYIGLSKHAHGYNIFGNDK